MLQREASYVLEDQHGAFPLPLGAGADGVGVVRSTGGEATMGGRETIEDVTFNLFFVRFASGSEEAKCLCNLLL